MRFSSEIFTTSVLFVLFTVIGLGYLLGRVRFPGGIRVGISGVLFIGVLYGAFFSPVRIPDEFLQLGIVLFVYGVGLEAGPFFIKNFKQEGWRVSLAMILTLLLTGSVIYVLILQKWVSPGLAAGIFAGALTSTPSLPPAIEIVTRQSGSPHSAEVQQVIAGYTVAYVIGSIAILIVLQFYLNFRRGNQRAIACPVQSNWEVMTVELESSFDYNQFPTLQSWIQGRQLIVSRYQTTSMNSSAIAAPDLLLTPHMRLVIIGQSIVLESQLSAGIKRSESSLQSNIEGFEVTWLVVSNSQLAGSSIEELKLHEYSCCISHLKRGDQEIFFDTKTILELGDRIRVISPCHAFEKVKKLFGDSMKTLCEIGFLSFSIGIAIGIILSNISFEAFSIQWSLGLGGGPLIAGLLLGHLGKTGSILWRIPPSHNMTIRNFGVLIFLGGVALNCGSHLFEFIQIYGVNLISTSLMIVFGTHILFMFILRFLNLTDIDRSLGYICALQTQPTGVGYLEGKSDIAAVMMAYAITFPVATILKIVLTQLILV